MDLPNPLTLHVPEGAGALSAGLDAADAPDAPDAPDAVCAVG